LCFHTLAHSSPSSRGCRYLFSCTYRLFSVTKFLIFFVFNYFHTLAQKQGVGFRTRSSEESFHFGTHRRHSPPLFFTSCTRASANGRVVASSPGVLAASFTR